MSPRFSYGSLLEKASLGADDARLFKALEHARDTLPGGSRRVES